MYLYLIPSPDFSPGRSPVPCNHRLIISPPSVCMPFPSSLSLCPLQILLPPSLPLTPLLSPPKRKPILDFGLTRTHSELNIGTITSSSGVQCGRVMCDGVHAHGADVECTTPFGQPEVDISTITSSDGSQCLACARRTMEPMFTGHMCSTQNAS